MSPEFAERFERRKFTLLLVSLVFVQLVPVISGSPDGAALGFPWGLVLLTAVYAASGNRRVTLIFGAVAVLGFSGRVATVFSLVGRFQDPLEAGSAILGAMFIGMTIVMILRAILRAPHMTGDMVMGAICVYLLIGFMWANFYALAELADPGSFNFPESARTAAGTVTPEYTFGYYSFVTLTTLGYGDITPITFRARTLSWMEAVFGVVYMATTIAFLVAQVLADQRMRRQL